VKLVLPKGPAEVWSAPSPQFCPSTLKYFSTLANDIVAGQRLKPTVANTVRGCGASSGSTSRRGCSSPPRGVAELTTDSLISDAVQLRRVERYSIKAAIRSAASSCKPGTTCE